MGKNMWKTFGAIGFGLGLSAALAIPALAVTTSADQIPAPVPSASNTAGNSEVLIQNFPISGGALYQSCFRGYGLQGPNGNGVLTECSGLTFVPTSLSGVFTRYLDLTAARLDTGIVSVATTGSSTSFGIARTAGSSYALVGAATSSSGVTTKAMWETNVASNYVTGTVIPVIVNANYTGAGTVTAASTTLTLTAYTEVGGVETSITGITAAQQFTGTPANYTFNIPTTAALVPGQHIVVEVTMLTTTSAGAATGQINSVGVAD